MDNNLISRRWARSRKIHARNHIARSGSRPEKGSTRYPWEKLICKREAKAWLQLGDHISRHPVCAVGVVFWNRRYGEACLHFTARLPAFDKKNALRDVSEDVVCQYEELRIKTRAQAD